MKRMHCLVALILCFALLWTSGCGETVQSGSLPQQEITTATTTILSTAEKGETTTTTVLSTTTNSETTTTTQKQNQSSISTTTTSASAESKLPAGVPAYSGSPYAVINGNQPQFDSITAAAFEQYILVYC